MRPPPCKLYLVHNNTYPFVHDAPRSTTLYQRKDDAQHEANALNKRRGGDPSDDYWWRVETYEKAKP